ncbi:hypothetical protein PGTUg99_005101 [Puccinia graminis f. sp. tritici]|uniref:Uncharacterized protein n=1 Tax=Puccinia graminis f. sp. tritici TaxID=56615 RepID=A0A5B0RX85_PUCGR|nr:hypothetical protein PGTUg99_005101 [Puccinia graminis f. sp. tritici]
MFTLMLRAYAITAVIFLVFSVQISAAEDCNEQNGCVQHCGTSMQPHYDDPKTKTCEFISALPLPKKASINLLATIHSVPELRGDVF